MTTRDPIALVEALAEPNVRAFLKMLRHGEGTDHDDGYRTLFGGGLFTSFADHPKTIVARMLGGRPLSSSAAGAYQFLSKTWAALVAQYGFADFSPKNQDLGAVALIDGRGALADVRAGRFEPAVAKCNREWASLPGSPYGQPTVGIDLARALYAQAGGSFSGRLYPQDPVQALAGPAAAAPAAPPITQALTKSSQPEAKALIMDTLKFDWKKLVAGIAPALGTALGGPMAGMAIKVIADKVLGEPEASEQDVAAAIASGHLSGEQIVALKQADQTFAGRMRELDIDLERLAQAGEAARLKDVQDARAQTVALASAGSTIAWGAPVISALIVVTFGACIWLLFLRGEDMPANIFNLVGILFGALTAAFIQVTNFWLGSSSGSKRSGDAVREIAVNQSRPATAEHRS